MLRNLTTLLTGHEWWQIAIELVVIWLSLYVIFRFLRGTRGAGVIKGFTVLVVLATFIVLLLDQTSDAFTRLNFLYDRFLGLLAILLIVVFQPELRQAMSRLGHAWSFRTSRGAKDAAVVAVADAVSFLSKSQFGALIAIERSSRLGGLIETGAVIDAKVDARLLKTIFWPNCPLHDLGVVIRGDRIVAASVQFPLAEEGILPVEYGSRHRAAVGLSLESDCIVVIVSEETGSIGIAEHGRLDTGIPREKLQAELSRRMHAQPPAGPSSEAEAAKRAAAARADGTTAPTETAAIATPSSTADRVKGAGAAGHAA
jgi:diadenylate cyclase